MINGNLEPNKAPLPTVLPKKEYFVDDETLEITPMKTKPTKKQKAPPKSDPHSSSSGAKKKVVFADEEVKENKYDPATSTFH